jgi:hypothetical protein
VRYTLIEVSTTRPQAAKFGGKVKLELEAPEFESHDEFIQACGGSDEALKWVNGNVATGAGNGARAYIRSAPEDAPESDIHEKANTISRGYAPTGSERGPSKKERLATFDALMARIKRGERVSDSELESLAGKFGA